MVVFVEGEGVGGLGLGGALAAKTIAKSIVKQVSF